MTLARILPNTLHVWPLQMGSSGWTPQLVCQLSGPVPSAAQLVAEVSGPHAWSLRWDVSESSEEDFIQELRLRSGDADSVELTGEFTVKLSLVSELEGVDQELGTARLTVEKADRGYEARVDPLLTRGAVWLDLSDNDAPRLNVSMWFGGEVSTYQLGAYLFHNGKKLKSSDVRDEVDVSDKRALTASHGATTAHTVQEFAFEFGKVKAWVNAEYGNMDGWHDLSKNPGDYEVKVLREKKLDRSLKFQIDAAGQLVKQGAVTPERYRGFEMEAPVTVLGKADGDWDRAAPALASFPEPFDVGVEPMYAARRIPEPVEAPRFSEEVQALLSKVLGDAENYHRWFFTQLQNGDANNDMVIMYHEQWTPKYDELAPQVAEDMENDWMGERHTLASVRAIIDGMAETARGAIAKQQSAAEDELAPFRALLANDKLAIFEEHPAPSYRYYTGGKRIIESPEELAEAKTWFFEGTENQGYVNERWTVRGWRFDDDGTIVERLDQSGFGANAPSSAFPD